MDAVFTAEMAGVFESDSAIYQTAPRYLGVAPSEMMTVASYKHDVPAAACLGFRTAFVARLLEFGPDGVVDVADDDTFDIDAAGFLDLAVQLDRCGLLTSTIRARGGRHIDGGRGHPLSVVDKRDRRAGRGHRRARPRRPWPPTRRRSR